MRRLINRTVSRQVSFSLLCILIPVFASTEFYIVKIDSEKMEKDTLQMATLAATTGARAYEQVLTTGLQDKAFTLDDVVNPKYQQIPGSAMDDPRFHTAFDTYLERTQGFEDAIFNNLPGTIYASGIDMEGFVPATNSIYCQQAKTGKDTASLDFNKKYARCKMKYTTALHLSAARTRQAVLIQPYTRDGVDCLDVAVPIYVAGHQFGAFRVGITVSSIEKRRAVLIGDMTVIFGAITIAVLCMSFFMVWRRMKPLGLLAEKAAKMSTGEDLDAKLVNSGRGDEVDGVSDSLDRMRRGFKYLYNERQANLAQKATPAPDTSQTIKVDPSLSGTRVG